MANLTDADKVLRNDTGKSIVSKLDGIKDAIVAQGGGAHSLDQLSDVDIDSQTLAAGQIIEYDDNDGKWKNVANPASTTNFGAPYDENTTYNVPSLVIYNNLLYTLNDGEDGTTGPWDPTKWTQTSVAELAELIGSLSTLTTTDKSSIVGAVNEVDGKFSGLLKVANCTTTYTVSANASVNVDDSFITNQTPSGYSYVGVVGFSTNDVNAVIISLRPFNSGVYSIQIKNMGSTALSNKTLLCQCLFIKTGGI